MSTCNSQYDFMSYQNKAVIFQHLPVGSICSSSSFTLQSHVAEKQQASPKVLLEVLDKLKRKPVPLHHSYTKIRVALVLVPRAVPINTFPCTTCTFRHFLATKCTTCCVICQFPYFILYYLTCKQHYSFSLQAKLHLFLIPVLGNFLNKCHCKIPVQFNVCKSLHLFCSLHSHSLYKHLTLSLHYNSCFPNTVTHQ